MMTMTTLENYSGTLRPCRCELLIYYTTLKQKRQNCVSSGVYFN